MTIQLPGAIASLLDEIGLEWPDIDEDLLREMSNEITDLATTAQQTIDQANSAAQKLIAANAGLGIEAFEKCWKEITGGPFKDLTDSSKSAARTLAQFADGV